MDDSMADSVFNVDSDGSDFGPPAPKSKVKAASKPKAASSKPAPKKPSTSKPGPKKTQTTLKAKPAASKKRPKPDTEDEDEDDVLMPGDDTLLSNTPPSAPPSAKKQKKAHGPKKMGAKPLREIENDAIAEAIEVSILDGADDAKPKKGSKATEQYQKLTQLEHIIKRPDTYIGSVEMQERPMWVYNSALESMEMRQVNFVPGLYKIFDEILVNAADNKQRDKNMDTIRVTINRESGEISILNNGRGIPIEIHEKEKIYIPEMIFGHLLTSSNYNDEEAKVTGGRNGYGAKLCNVYSTNFTLETADSKTKKKYKQTWTENMSKMGKASIVDNKGDDFTKITFTPDFEKFKMSGIDDDFEALVKRRVYDLAGTSKGVKVWLNGERLKIKNFKGYMEMYTKAIKRERGDEAANDTSDIITDNPEVRWKIGFAVSDGTFQQVSFVNSIATTSGGTHVNYIADQVCTKLLDIVKKKKTNKAANLKISQIKNHIFLFVNCLIVNPAFTSQTKEQLTTKHTQFGSKCNVSDEFLKKIAKTEVVENILHFAEQKADQILKKSDGNRRSRMDNPKLTDANRAGTKDGYQCTLVLTEGDSAKGLALAGRSVVSPDLFGVYPLRGKMLNVRDASVDQISKNAEIQNIKNFLGLKHKQVYTDCKSLRYGHLMIMTDQDHDGSHIKGLLINFLQVQFPSLLKIPGFLLEFITPIVKAWKGNPKAPIKSHSFFTMPEYAAFKESHKHERGWEHKYYKGLGTSSALEAQAYFRDLDQHLKEFHTMKDEEVQMVELAFSKKMADERKEWLRQFVPGTYMDHSERGISYTDFINKELILFSMADNVRSIPSVVDGLKPGQRKVLFTCFKRNLRKDMKVVELAGAVSGFTAYQHGESSLQTTIVGLAQTFVGSNNLNCLEPSGNFGSRLQGGADAASARYIYTRLSPFARKVFHTADEPVLTYHTDEDRRIEPHVYVPVVPLVLINGSDGIGTGWSSNIPNYNPEDVVENLMLMMAGEPMKPMIPWFRDFKGTVTQTAPDRYKFSGVIKQTGDHELEITELPIRVWTQDYKDKIVEIIKAEKTPSFIKDYDDYNTHNDVHFVLRMEEKHMKLALEEGLEEKFKLSKSIATSNLVAFDEQGRITKYASVEDIMKEFFGIRIKFYQKRKANQLEEMTQDLEKFTNQARFIQMIITGKLVVSKKKKAVLVQELREKNFKPISKSNDALKDKSLDPLADEEEEKEHEADAELGAADYDYLLSMPIWSLTQERIDRLQKQIGEREDEIDTLSKLTPQDIWKIDLEAFIHEWRFQLQDEADRQKKAAKLGRRASRKVNIGVGGRKRKVNNNSDDSDFDAAPKAKKGNASKALPGGMLNYLAEKDNTKKPSKPKAPSATAKFAQKAIAQDWFGPSTKKEDEKKDGEDDIWMSLDGATEKTKSKAPTALKKPPSQKEDVIPPDSDIEEEEIARPAAGTNKPRRAAANKPAKYALSDSDDDSDGEFDVGAMVKGINNADDNNPRPLFSTSNSRPGSSAGLQPRKSTTGRDAFDVDADDTDYTKLAPPTTSKGPPVIARQTILSDDDDDGDDSLLASSPHHHPPPARAPQKPAAAAAAAKSSKPAPATKLQKFTTTTSKKRDPTPQPKQVPALSPAAKAYAAKKAKSAKQAAAAADDDDDDDEVDKVANEIMADDDDDDDDNGDVIITTKAKSRAAAAASSSARPGRAAASKAASQSKAKSKSKKYADSSDDEEDEEEEESEEEDFDEGDDESFD